MSSIILLYKKKLIFITSAVMLALLIAVYIFQINALTGTAYTIAEQEDLMSNLKAEMRDLETQYVQFSSFQDMELLAQDLHFQKIDHITYIKASDGSVARNTGN